MYLPPRPQAASRRGGYQRTVERLFDWLDGCLSEQKHRTTPLFSWMPMMELAWELRAGRYRPVYCQSIVAAGARRVHVAGKRLGEIMEKHHMRATSAELGGATCFGGTGSSLIHCVWALAALPLRCSGPLRRMAAELQLIGTRQVRDHVLLDLEFDYVQLAGQPAPGEKRGMERRCSHGMCERWFWEGRFLGSSGGQGEGRSDAVGAAPTASLPRPVGQLPQQSFWSGRGSDSSRKNRWMRQVMQT